MSTLTSAWVARAPLSDFGPWVDVVLVLTGSAVLLSLFRWWRGPDLGVRQTLFLLALVAIVTGRPLATRELEIPSTTEYRLSPWRESISEAPRSTNPALTDISQVLLPFREIANRRLRSGELPLWSHELGLGQPLLANGQSAPFAPFHLLAIFLPAERGMTVSSALGLLLGLVGALLFARALGIGETGSLIAATTVGLSGFVAAWRYYPLGLVAAHLPALALAWLGLLRGERKAAPAAALLLASALLSGNPELLALAALPATIALLLSLLREPAEGRRRVLGGCTLAVLVGCSISAPAWLPLLTAIPESARLAELRENPDLVAPPELELTHVATLWQPFAAGSPWDESGIWSGQRNWNELASSYAGVLPLALALFGCFVGAVPRWVMAFGSWAFCFAFPIPYVWAFLSSIPGLQLITLSRSRVFWILAVGLGAGYAIEHLRRASKHEHLAAGGFVLGSVALALLAATEPSRVIEGWHVAVTGLGAVLFVAMLTLKLTTRRAGTFALGALSLDLVLLVLAIHPIVPEEMDFRPPSVVRRIATELALAPDSARVAALDGRLVPYVSAMYGFWDPRGHDAMRPAAALQWLRDRFGRSKPGEHLSFGSPPDFDALAFLAVRFLLTGPGYSLPSPWERIHLEPRLALWRDPTPRPLFFSPTRLTPAGSERTARELGTWSLRVAGEASIADWELASREPQTITVKSCSPVNNGFDLLVDAPKGGVLVSSIAAVRGWVASSPGATSRVVRVNGAFLGLALSPEVGRVHLRYAPPGWSIAKLLALLGTLGLSILVVASARSRSRRAL